MTTHPIDTEALRARAEHVFRHGGPPNAIESLAANIPEILDRLAAAEHRATRAEAQSAIRGRAVAIYQQRAREAEARIKAVQDALDADEHVTKHMGTLGQWRPDVPAIAHGTIRRALDGDA